jgi:hypothetical protein
MLHGIQGRILELPSWMTVSTTKAIFNPLDPMIVIFMQGEVGFGSEVTVYNAV